MPARVSLIVAAMSLLALAPPEDDGWDAVVKGLVGRYEVNKAPGSDWLAKRLRTLFEVRGVGHVQVFVETDGKKTLAQDIYYAKGQLHVVAHGKGWNLITEGEQAYEWEDGGFEAIVTKASDRDLIDYLLYLTDPSVIMEGMYGYTLEDPALFLPPKASERGVVEWRFKKPTYGFAAVRVSTEPAWLCGFEVRDPHTDKPSRFTLTIPTSLKEVPAEVLGRKAGIKFEKSNLSIRRHLVYL